MFSLFSKQADNLLSMYLMYFKINFFKDRIKAEESLDLLLSLLNDNLDVPEWNRAMRALAKAWKFDAQDSESIVDVIKIKRDLMDKVLTEIGESGQMELFQRAERGTSELFEEIDPNDY